MSVILAFRRLRLEDREFEASLNYIVTKHNKITKKPQDVCSRATTQ
jgi:hypothetical protein